MAQRRCSTIGISYLALSPKGRGDKAETLSRTESSRPARRSRAIHTWDDIAPGNEVTDPHPSPLSKGRGDQPKSLRLVGETPSRTESSRPAWRSHAIHTWDDIAPGNDVTDPLTLTLSRKGGGDQTEVSEAGGRNPIEGSALVSCAAKPCHSGVEWQSPGNDVTDPLTLTLSRKGRGDKAETPSRAAPSCPARRSRAIEAWGGIHQAMPLPTPHPSPLPQGERGANRSLRGWRAEPCRGPRPRVLHGEAMPFTRGTTLHQAMTLPTPHPVPLPQGARGW
ncbi:hypothetical protein WP2W18C05_17650 [Aeromonas sp. WP2-W18-CRE-05]|nr:hypothetical protein WP2W18C05_17650 [Aeromonas sp. WP2-W18-CRE-05]